MDTRIPIIVTITIMCLHMAISIIVSFIFGICVIITLIKNIIIIILIGLPKYSQLAVHVSNFTRWR